jgi:putative tricarboxylic transport membrane protein
VRPYQVATAAVLILIAAVAMFDTRAGALPDPSGGAPGGLKGGWYPFWSAGVAALAGAIVLYRSAVVPQPATGIFRGREGIVDVVRLIAPMIALVLLMDQLLGFYISGALYLAFFGRFIGRYRWIWVVLMAIAIPAALYFIFEQGFRVALPKSIFYVQGFPF